LPAKGRPVFGSTIDFDTDEKSPWRIAALGTNAVFPNVVFSVIVPW
jgi:hypothetical protein